MCRSTIAIARGPGQGNDKFAPVFAALRRHKYQGVVAVEPFDYQPDGAALAARAIGYIRGLARSAGSVMSAPLFRVAAIELFERDVTLRLPFKFGVVTLTARAASLCARPHRFGGWARGVGCIGGDAGAEMVRQESGAEQRG